MERIRCAATMCGGIGQGVDDLHLLDDRSGPSVRDDERQRVLVLRTDVQKVDVQPSISVMNCGYEFNLVSTLRQS
jgi:hypothetical protein